LVVRRTALETKRRCQTAAPSSVTRLARSSSSPPGLPPSDSVARGELVGTVVDAETGKPLVDTQIAVLASMRATLSDSTGHFRIVLPAGATNVLVRRIGFGTVNLVVPEHRDSGLVAVLALRRSPIGICAVRVT
jgi:hypothetical protein